MLRVHPSLLMIGLRDIALCYCRMVYARGDTDGEPLSSNLRQEADESLANLRLESMRAELPAPLIKKIDRIRAYVSRPNITVASAETYLKELGNDLLNYVSAPAYFRMPDDLIPYFEQATPLVDPSVFDKFDVERDIKRAGECIALGQSTAAVFHLMRAAEIALRRLADDLCIKPSQQEWGYLLKHIDGALRQMEDSRRSPERDARSTYYSQARIEFAAINEAWRKHCMHAREFYEPREAISIFGHVKALLERLTMDPPP